MSVIKGRLFLVDFHRLGVKPFSCIPVVTGCSRVESVPPFRCSSAASIFFVHPPEHGLRFNVLRCLSLHAPILSTATANHDGTTAGTPGSLLIGIKLIGDEFGPARVSHKPHLRLIYI